MAGRAMLPKKSKAAPLPQESQVAATPVEETERLTTEENRTGYSEERVEGTIEEQIRRRAHQIYLQRGGQHGSDVDDWLQAEAEIRQSPVK